MQNSFKYFAFRASFMMVSNKNMIMSSFKSIRNIQKKECGPDRSVSDNQSSSVTLNEQAEKAIIIYCVILNFNKEVIQ